MTPPKKDIQSVSEGLAEAIDRFEPAAAQLHEATKIINEQIESFKTLSQSAQDQIKSSIKAATHEIAETVAKEIASIAEKQIADIIQPLDRSAQYALRALHDTKHRKRIRLIGFFFMGCVITGLIGFGAGYYLCSLWMNSLQKVRSFPSSPTPLKSSLKAPQNERKGARKNDSPRKE